MVIKKLLMDVNKLQKTTNLQLILTLVGRWLNWIKYLKITLQTENFNKIIQRIFSKGDPKAIKEIMDCLSKNNDNTIKGEVRELARLIGLAGDKDLRDVPLGGLGSNNEDPDKYPNQNQDGSSHFG